MLSLIDIALRRGTELLFEEVNVTISQGKKVGLIGANGAGKTSLFKMIVGELDSDRGAVDLPAGTRIAYLRQEVPASAEAAINYVLGGDEEYARIQAEIEQAQQEDAFEKIGHLHDQLANVDGYTARSRAEQLMVGLGFGHDEFEKSLGEFSGGWRIRLNLARTLMTPSDLLMLDEPTNHLDLDAILWLSDWIKRYQGTMLLISHDREFLDETVNQIAYLHRNRIELFTGNYTGFERIKAERLSEQQASYEKQQREIKHMESFVRRFRAKASKAKQAQGRIKALERMERIAPAHIDSPFRFSIPAAEKTSSPLLAIDQATLGYGDIRVLENVRLSLEPGDRLGLLGHNGAGKSTLVKTLRGELPLISGSRVEGVHLAVGYFSQHQVDELDLDQSAVAHIQRLDPDLPEQEIRNFLGGFDFRGDKVYDPVRIFSGGEKARLALAVVCHSKPNLLLMDEPTNHLDMDMRQALTVALQDFEGAIVLISHDRHLLASTVDEFLLVHDGGVQLFKGDLEDYRKRLFDEKPGEQPGKQPTTEIEETVQVPVKKSREDHKRAKQLKTRIRTLDERLTRLQRKLQEVEEKLGDSSLYAEGGQSPDLQRLLREQLGLKDEIDELEAEWLENSEALESLETGTT